MANTQESSFYQTLGISIPEPSKPYEFYEEDIQPERLREALNTTYDVWNETREIVKKYIAYISSTKKIIYEPSKKQDGYGRVYCKNGIGMQAIYRLIRNAVCYDNYVDIDIKNAHPVILLQICERMGWKCDKLQQYVENREEMLQKVQQHFKVSRDDAKTLFIRILYGGNVEKWKDDAKTSADIPDFVVEMANEFNGILNNHWNSNSIAVNIVKKKKKEEEFKKNPKSSALSITLQIEEHRILNECINFFTEQNKTIRVLCFDGLMLQKDANLNAEILTQLEKYVQDNTSWCVSFDYKPMEDRLFKWEEIQQTRPAMQPFDMRHMASLIDYDSQKLYFEQYVCQINSPACFVKKCRHLPEEMELIKPRDLMHNFSAIKYVETKETPKGIRTEEGKFIKKWVDDVEKRVYDKMDFLPYGMECPAGVYNTFNGFEVEKCKVDACGDTTIFYEHLKLLVGNDDACYEYILNFFAHMIQKPAELPEICVVLKSIEGVGKNLFMDNFGKYILGDSLYLQTAKMEHICGRFNINFNKLLVVFDEVKGKDSFENSEILKNIITSPTLQMEKKGIDVIQTRNFGRYFMLTNNETPVKITKEDRRFVVFECSDEKKGNREYFTKLMNAFKNKAVCKKFYEELKGRDIEGFDFYNSRPITKIYKDIQEMTKSKVDLFLEWICEEERKEYHMTKREPLDFYNEFVAWNKNNGFDKTMTNTLFGRHLKKYTGGCLFKKTSQKRFYCINCDVLKAELKCSG